MATQKKATVAQRLTRDIKRLDTEVAELTNWMSDLAVEERLTDLENEVAGLKDLLKDLKDAVEESGGRKKRRSNLTDEQRKAAGERLQMGRAKSLGLDSIEQLRALRLRPGQKPTKKQIAKVKKDYPILKAVEDDDEDGSLDREDLESKKVAELRKVAKDRGVKVPSGAKKADIVDAILAEDDDLDEEE